jgi:hypothetical protein
LLKKSSEGKGANATKKNNLANLKAKTNATMCNDTGANSTECIYIQQIIKKNVCTWKKDWEKRSPSDCCVSGCTFFQKICHAAMIFHQNILRNIPKRKGKNIPYYIIRETYSVSKKEKKYSFQKMYTFQRISIVKLQNIFF